MNKSDVFLIISQIYFVGSMISEDQKVFLIIMGVVWLVLCIIAGPVKL